MTTSFDGAQQRYAAVGWMLSMRSSLNVLQAPLPVLPETPSNYDPHYDCALRDRFDARAFTSTTAQITRRQEAPQIEIRAATASLRAVFA